MLRGEETPVCLDEANGPYRGLDPPQDCVPISQLPLAVVDFLQTSIDDLGGPTTRHLLMCPSASARNCRDSSSAGEIGRFCCILSRRWDTFQRLDEFALAAGPLQPGNQFDSLDEDEDPQLLTVGQFLVQVCGVRNVFRNRHILLLPGDVDAAQVDQCRRLGVHRRETRRGGERQTYWRWGGEVEVSGYGKGVYFIRRRRRRVRGSGELRMGRRRQGGAQQKQGVAGSHGDRQVVVRPGFGLELFTQRSCRFRTIPTNQLIDEVRSK